MPFARVLYKGLQAFQSWLPNHNESYSNRSGVNHAVDSAPACAASFRTACAVYGILHHITGLFCFCLDWTHLTLNDCHVTVTISLYYSCSVLALLVFCD